METTSSSGQITGKLGKPLGTILEIRGVIETPQTRADSDSLMVRIDSIDSKPAEDPIGLVLFVYPFSGIILPDSGTQVTLIGYESGEMAGIPEEAFRYIPRVASEGFHFKSFFVVLAIVE